MAVSFSTIGYVFDITGLFWLAKHYHRLGATLAEQTQHLMTIGVAHMMLMNHQFYLATWILHWQMGSGARRQVAKVVTCMCGMHHRVDGACPGV